jgi:hypothetical protein
MFKTSLPTDNIYKMLFYFGILLFVVSFMPVYHIHKLNINIIRLNGEIEEYKMKKGWLDNDSNGYEEGVKFLEKYKQWEPKMIQALNPGTEEANTFTEMTGSPIEPGIAELVMSLDSPEEIEKKKNEGIQEIKSSLDIANNKLKLTRRELKENETKIKTKNSELLKTQQYLKYSKTLAYIVRLIGVCILLIGYFKWRTITQKCEDLILKGQSN